MNIQAFLPRINNAVNLFGCTKDKEEGLYALFYVRQSAIPTGRPDSLITEITWIFGSKR